MDVSGRRHGRFRRMSMRGSSLLSVSHAMRILSPRFPRSPFFSSSLATLLFSAALRWPLVHGSCLTVCFSVLEHEKQRRRHRTDKARQKTGGQVWRLQLRLALGSDRLGGAGDENEAGRRRARVRPMDRVGRYASSVNAYFASRTVNRLMSEGEILRTIHGYFFTLFRSDTNNESTETEG